MLGATGSFCCRLNRCRVVATTIADGARAMATIAARVLQASIDSPTSAGAFLHVAAASSLLTSATPYGRICGLSVLHRSSVDRRERGSQLEQPSMACGVHGRSSSSKADEGRARVGALRLRDIIVFPTDVCKVHLHAAFPCAFQTEQSHLR